MMVPEWKPDIRDTQKRKILRSQSEIFQRTEYRGHSGESTFYRMVSPEARIC